MLPVLQHLDVSNNKLSSLPYKMWTAPKLRELNVALNLLHDLPTKPEGFSIDTGLIKNLLSLRSCYNIDTSIFHYSLQPPQRYFIMHCRLC